MKKILFAFCLVALLAASPVMAQADFSNYIALGDSLTAGLASGSLMNWYQERSYPALLAQQAGAPAFQAPWVSQPGIGPILELVSLQGPVIAPVGLIPGLPTNADYPGIYNNLGIPTATLEEMIFQTGDIGNLVQGNFDTVMFDLVLRDGISTALEQAIVAQPTFVTVWIGNADILSAGLAATPIDGITMTPIEVFEPLYNNAIGALVTNTNADIVLINIPDRAPFFTTVPPLVDIPGLGLVPLMADTGPLSPDDWVNLSAGPLIAAGYGLPGGPPLPDNLNPLTMEPGYVLRSAEQAIIEGRIAAYNAVIASAAETYGLTVVDANALFRSWTGPNPPEFATINLTADFLTGGIFSYDGIHLQNIGSALVAAEIIEVINTELGANIPQVDMVTTLYEGDWQTPGAVPLKIEEVVFSTDAFEQLWDLFKPKNVLPSPRVRRLDDGNDNRPRPQLRRRPTQ